MRLAKGLKYFKIGEISGANRLAYLSDHLSGSLFLLLVLFVFSQVWRTALAEGEIAGFNKANMLWYMVFTEVITLSAPAVGHRVSEEVKSGELAYQLIRPYSYPLYYFSLYWGEFAVRFCSNLVVGSLYAFFVMGALRVDVSLIPLYVLGILLAASLNFLVLFSLALLAFWVEDNSPFFWVHGKMLFIFGGLFIPVEAYPSYLKTLSVILPFRYGISAPARLIVDFNWSTFTEMLTGQLIWIGIMSSIICWMFQKGVRQVNVHGG